RCSIAPCTPPKPCSSARASPSAARTARTPTANSEGRRSPVPDPLEQLRTPDEPVAPRDEFRWVLRRRIVDALGVDPTRIPVDPTDLIVPAQEATTMTTTTTSTITAITPYLTVHDGAAAIAFYTEAFGAIEEFRVVGDDGRVGHAELRIGAARLELSDEYPEIDVRSPEDLGGSTFALSLTVNDC